LRSGTGAGLWMVLLMSVGYSPLAIYAPLFCSACTGSVRWARATWSPWHRWRGP
jgi:hypothetical protein